MNFSNTNNHKLIIELNDNIIIDRNNPLYINIIGRMYNKLRIFSGFGSLELI